MYQDNCDLNERLYQQISDSDSRHVTSYHGSDVYAFLKDLWMYRNNRNLDENLDECLYQQISGSPRHTLPQE